MSNKRAIFLLIGQSNMAGRGLCTDVPALSNPRIFMWRDDAWQKAEEPLHRDKAAAGIGLAMSFAHDLVDDPGFAEIGLLPCAVGGTPLQRWQPEGDLYQHAVNTTHRVLDSGYLAGILWHQGENDANNQEAAQSYLSRIRVTFQQLRQDLNASRVPLLIGELGPFLQHNDRQPHFQQVNDALRQVAAELSPAAFVSAEGLEDNGDHLHFNAPSLREFGHRYATAFRTCHSAQA